MQINERDLSLIATTIRTLAMDAVQQANSGHPGMPMGCADIAAVLWTHSIRYNPADPGWMNRDRFVLSAGHGSMLLYSVLHLAGYGISLDDLKKFRQWQSLTPGHPEFAHTPGVETTTGPLGQGFANAVGMAYASALLAAEFNTPGSTLIDHAVYAIVSDGDLMEGISSEAASLAGHMALGNIIFVYDSNGISIEGGTDLAFSEDIRGRFLACGWHVQDIDGHDYAAIAAALDAARAETAKPSLIIARTRIAKGSPGMEGSAESHGAPLGADEVRAAKERLGSDPDSSFYVSERAYELFRERASVLRKDYDAWKRSFDSMSGDLKAKWDRFFGGAPDIASLRAKLPSFQAGSSHATRNAGGTVLASLFHEVPNLVGGSADLAPSNKTFVKGFTESGRGRAGRNMHFGIREHAMGAIQNGIAYYGGFIPYSATFFVFMDYMRPAVRLAALSSLHTVYVFTHDSFHVGEDGPTHQPVEHLAAARAIPNLTVIRPADAEETREAWLTALTNHSGPTALLLTRQNLPVLDRSAGCDASSLSRGAYVIGDPAKSAELIIMASGSEVSLAVDAAAALAGRGIAARVVSFPSWELFEKQSTEYRESVLPPSLATRVVIEAGISMGWERYAGSSALFITLERFGSSAPAGVLAEKFGFSPGSAVEKILAFLNRP